MLIYHVFYHLTMNTSDPRGSYVTKILYVKTKESGPVGGGACAGHAPPKSANEYKVWTYDLGT